MKHLYKLLLAFFLLPAFASAQSNYKPGEVVTLKGDTLKGFIDYQAWGSNPTEISFKTALADNNPQKLTIDNIVFFNVDDITAYQKFTGRISMDETNTAHLTAGRDTSYRMGTVFLQLLQKGKNVSLYAYSDNLKTRFYLGEAPAFTPVELVFRLYDAGGAVSGTEGSTVVGNSVYENTYQKTLFALANKYNALDDNMTRVFQTANYTKADLLAIVSKINHISAAEYEKKYTEHTKINFYAGAALNISTTSASTAASYSTGGGKSSTSFLPALSFGVNINPDPLAGKVEFRVDVALVLSKFNSVYLLKVSPFTTNTASYNQTTISLTPQIIYNFYNAATFKVYIGAGVAWNHSGFSNAFFGNRQNPTADGPNSASEPYYFSNNNDSFLIKAGFKLGSKLEVFFNYYTSMAITQGGYFGFNNSSKQIGVAYFFGK